MERLASLHILSGTATPPHTLSDMTFRDTLARCWRLLRAACGDDAYERYLVHWRDHHAHDDQPPLSRREFFRSELERRWNGVKRCC